MAGTLNLNILQGSTFRKVLRWEAPPIVYKPITGIAKAAPAVLTVANHGVPDGWRVAVTSVVGMTEINAKTVPPKDKDYRKATVLGSGSIELNEVNAAEFSTYESGGYLQYFTPVDLADYTARLTVKDKVGGTMILQMTTEDGGITLDNAAKTITLKLLATATDDLTFSKGVYDLEMVDDDGVVTRLVSGTVSLSKEVTTP